MSLGFMVYDLLIFKAAGTAINFGVIIREILKSVCNINNISRRNIFQPPIKVSVKKFSIKVAPQIEFASFTPKRVALAETNFAEKLKFLVKENDETLPMR